ncbi:hypothetical protein M0Q50_09250 [bacterium]|jgi:hypothetical protein|nr:hypothetical protein [bacterium]
MGCHTWFYRKIDNVPYDKVKEQFIKNLKYDIKFFYNMVYHKDRIKKEYLDIYPNYGPEYFKHRYDVFVRQLRLVENDYCKVAVCKRYHYRNNPTIYFNGSHYVSFDSLPHDTFRIYGYPIIKLKSYEETIKFINDNKNNEKFWCLDSDYEDVLKKFWNKYPDSFICFG